MYLEKFNIDFLPKAKYIYICFCYDEIRCVTDEKRRIKKNTTQKSYVFRCFFKFSDVFFGFPMLSVKNPTFWVKFLDLFP